MRSLAVIATSAIAVLMAANLPREAPDLTVHMPGGGQISLGQYRGKVVAMCFILTTCPHCQKTTGYLIQAQKEYGPRGFQVVESAIEGGADKNVAGFVQAFHTNFPVGFNDPMTAIGFMQHPPAVGPHMPLLAFLDRKGMIQAQYEGDDAKFFGDDQEKNIRGQIEDLLKAPGTGGTTKSGAKKAAKKTP
jgi:hypothetical protein